MSKMKIEDSNFPEDFIKFDDKTGVLTGFNAGVGTKPTQETKVKINKRDVDRFILLLQWYKEHGK